MIYPAVLWDIPAHANKEIKSNRPDIIAIPLIKDDRSAEEVPVDSYGYTHWIKYICQNVWKAIKVWDQNINNVGHFYL